MTIKEHQGHLLAPGATSKLPKAKMGSSSLPGLREVITKSKTMQFLRETTVRDMIDQRLPQKLESTIEEYKSLKSDVNQFGVDLIDVPADAPIEEAFTRMRVNNITKLPVYVVTEGGKKYVGIVTTFDMLHYLVFQAFWDRCPTKADARDEINNVMVDRAHVFDAPVKTLIGESLDSVTLTTVYMEDTLDSLLKALEYRHETLVTDRAHEFSAIHTGLISQSDVVWYLLNNRTAIGDEEVFTTPASEVLELVRQRQDLDPNQLLRPGETKMASYVVKAGGDVSAISCFRMMRTHRVSSCAIVDRDDQLVDTISASDLRGIARGSIADLLLPVTEYLRKHCTWRMGKVAKIGPEEELGRAMELAVESKIHRVYLATPENKPVGVLTMTDMLYFIATGGRRHAGNGHQ